MKKYIVILSSLWLLDCNCYPQGLILGSYVEPIPKTFLIKNVETIDFEFDIFNNNRYVLMINNEDGSDFHWYIMLSRGKYHQYGNKLRFKDECYHFNMEAVVNHRSFTFSSAPDFLMKRNFALHYPADEKWEEPPYYSPYSMTRADVRKHNHIYKEKLEFQWGLYREYHMGIFDFRLNIMENHRYVLTCNEYVFSKGKWERHHNTVVLKDDMGFLIRLLIKENRLLYKYEPDKFLVFRYNGNGEE